ncbi:phosphate transport system protein [Halomicrobium zhouii]|uniref:Phosphate transport system protein n=1 Tax=Halomicrobium zhouii TaxID=767519 RepID=A0A1I6M307_9EURY|nr:AbrB/MazE/SpoVT family DNA-binding domain-containing protein [Halomicrobium zhouii]SFS10043.1 phosphate transport system protein [Halomicrobium zhouii]
METRKIQIAGGTTYTVSLPKEWASDHDLEAGARVRVHPYEDGSLLVQTAGHAESERDPLRLAPTDASVETLRRQVRAAYETGREAVEVTGDAVAAADQRALRDVAASLLGVDVVQRSGDRVRYRSLLDASTVSLEQSLRQLQFVADSALGDAASALVDEDRSPHRIEERATEAGRLAALVGRQFVRSLDDPAVLDDLGVERTTLFDYHAAATELERIVEHATTVVTVAGRRRTPVPEDVAETLVSTADDARDGIERSMSVLLDGGTAATACDVLDDCERVDVAQFDRLDDDAPAWLGVVFRSLVDAVEASGAIAAVALRAALRDGEYDQ